MVVEAAPRMKRLPLLALPATRAARVRRSGTALRVAVLVLSTVACGWLLRDRIPLTPKSGPGYGLGIAGGVTMLVLGLYPARKNLRFMRSWGRLSEWFHIHMILGVVGPLLILFHCDFHLGAPNSSVALASMLLVATSGVIGRYIYTHINHGLYGARATLEELHQQLDLSAHTLGDLLPPASRASQRLAAFAARAQAPQRTIAGRFVRVAGLPLLARLEHGRVRRDLRADLDAEAGRSGWDARARRTAEETIGEMIASYIAALVKEVQFSAYQRLASLWHAVHVPLFIMLILTAIVHVIAVHMY